MLAGFASTLIFFALAALLLPAAARPATPSHALRWLALLPIPLLASIGALARHRFFSREDIDGSGLAKGSTGAGLLQAILQNTLEQTVLAAVVYAGFVFVAPPRLLGMIPAAVLMFLAGRALFARGYRSGAAARALGFALTFYPTLVLAGIAVALFGVRLTAG